MRQMRQCPILPGFFGAIQLFIRKNGHMKSREIWSMDVWLARLYKSNHGWSKFCQALPEWSPARVYSLLKLDMIFHDIPTLYQWIFICVSLFNHMWLVSWIIWFINANILGMHMCWCNSWIFNVNPRYNEAQECKPLEIP